MPAIDGALTTERPPHMSEAHDVALKMIAAIEGGRIEEAARLHAPNCDFSEPDGSHRSLDRWSETSHAMVGAAPDAKWEITSILEAGDSVAVEFHWRGTHSGPLPTKQGAVPASGRRIDLRSCMILKVEDGLITEHHGYMDRLEFLSQLGLMGGEG
jgi:steroid delta-isomerase-like uncharacterized protein